MATVLTDLEGNKFEQLYSDFYWSVKDEEVFILRPAFSLTEWTSKTTIKLTDGYGYDEYEIAYHCSRMVLKVAMHHAENKKVHEA